MARLIAAHKRERIVYTMELAEQVSAEAAAAAGTQFTCFTGTTVQKLTQKCYAARGGVREDEI